MKIKIKIKEIILILTVFMMSQNAFSLEKNELKCLTEKKCSENLTKNILDEFEKLEEYLKEKASGFDLEAQKTILSHTKDAIILIFGLDDLNLIEIKKERANSLAELKAKAHGYLYEIYLRIFEENDDFYIDDRYRQWLENAKPLNILYEYIEQLPSWFFPVLVMGAVATTMTYGYISPADLRDYTFNHFHGYGGKLKSKYGFMKNPTRFQFIWALWTNLLRPPCGWSRNCNLLFRGVPKLLGHRK